jgi:hypothetical protein
MEKRNPISEAREKGRIEGVLKSAVFLLDAGEEMLAKAVIEAAKIDREKMRAVRGK